MTESSDVDVLVRFRKKTTARQFFGLRKYLETLLQRPIDLATERMIKPAMRDRVQQELTHVA